MSSRPISSRKINSLFKRAGFGYGSRKYLVRWVQMLMRPVEYLARKARLRRLDTRLNIDYGELREKGYVELPSAELPGLDDLLSVCRTIYNERKSIVESGLQGEQGYLHNLFEGSDYRDHREILDFVLSRDVLAVAGRYLGCVPRLGSVQLWWTPVNTGLFSSQKFHMDREDLTQAKFFINLLDVSDENGPLTFIPAPKSRKIREALKYDEGKITDEDVLRHCTEQDYVKCVGGSEKVWMLDTSRCLHFGARARGKERLVLMFTFTTGYEMKEPVNNFPSGFDSWFDGDEVRRMVVSA